MLDVLPTLMLWLDKKLDIAIAIVVKTWGSSPRQPGAWMVVNENGEFAGSVSGGCVEGAVIDTALRSIRTQKTDYLHFGVSDETAWEVGLACGGEIDIYLRPVLQSQPDLVEAYLKLGEIVREETSYTIAHVVQGPEGYPGQYYFASEVGQKFGEMDEELRGWVFDGGEDEGRWTTTSIKDEELPDGVVSIFIEHHRPMPKLVIVGGVHIAIPLAKQAKSLGFAVFIIEPRRAFSEGSRFPEVDQILSVWPDAGLDEIGIDSSTAVAVLTHDPKIDDPALRMALMSPAFYVGALGSKTTQEKRRKRLLDGGLTEAQLDKLHAPIGLDLGGRAPAEIALSIMAEIVAVRASHSISVPHK
jgi:xanthine dehydrogenase accessory factor